MPNSILFIGDVLAIWIVVQIVMGKAIYRRTRVSQQNDKRAFWALISLQALITVPILCLQFRLDIIAQAIFLVLVAVLLGFLGYILWLLIDVIIHPRKFWGQLCQDYAENPKKFLMELFLGRQRK